MYSLTWPGLDCLDEVNMFNRKPGEVISWQYIIRGQLIIINATVVKTLPLLHFVAFFHVASLFVSQVENRKVGVDNRKVK